MLARYLAHERADAAHARHRCAACGDRARQCVAARRRRLRCLPLCRPAPNPPRPSARPGPGPAPPRRAPPPAAAVRPHTSWPARSVGRQTVRPPPPPPPPPPAPSPAPQRRRPRRQGGARAPSRAPRAPRRRRAPPCATRRGIPRPRASRPGSRAPLQGPTGVASGRAPHAFARHRAGSLELVLVLVRRGLCDLLGCGLRYGYTCRNVRLQWCHRGVGINDGRDGGGGRREPLLSMLAPHCVLGRDFRIEALRRRAGSYVHVLMRPRRPHLPTMSVLGTPVPTHARCFAALREAARALHELVQSRACTAGAPPPATPQRKGAQHALAPAAVAAQRGAPPRPRSAACGASEEHLLVPDFVLHSVFSALR